MNSPQWESKVITPAKWLSPMLTWRELTPNPFAIPQPGQTRNMFVRFYKLDAVANSDVEFGRRILTFAGPFTSAPHRGVGTVYPGSTTSIGRVKPHTNLDTSTLAMTLGATTTLAHTSELVITTIRPNTSLAQLFRL